MLVGVPKEIKDQEYRVGMTAAGVKAMVSRGHKLMMQKSAGVGSGISDAEYVAAGAEIVDTAEEIYKRAEMIVKVKEPVPPEPSMLREGQLLFTYLHLAPVPDLTNALMCSGATCVAYETVQLPDGSLPLLAPMSEVAGRLAPLVGSECMAKFRGGQGILLGGVPGVPPATVVIVGGGVVGIHAAKMAVGLGARVIILNRGIDRLRYLDDIFQGRVETLASNDWNIEAALKESDLAIGGVLIAGARAPHVVKRETVKKMKPGSVIVDVAIDQGGCFETSRGTSHSNPTYIDEGVIHYCVTNMPGMVPRTSTFALTNATLPYALALADKGAVAAAESDPSLAKGYNVVAGKITFAPVAEAQGLSSASLKEVL
jgi:alanine dehydrogenase